MAAPRPTARPSTAPSKTSTAQTVKPPPVRRATMEVQMAWLDPPKDEAPPSEQPASSKRRPPRVPGSTRTLPPMPVASSSRPPPRPTMEVDMAWVELVDEAAAKAPATPAETTKPKKLAKKPLRREE